MCRFTSRVLICDTVGIHRSAVQNRWKSSFFRTFFAALRWILAVSQIRNREVYLSMILHLFHTHHFVVWSIAKYLIAPEVLAGFCQEKYRLGADYYPPPSLSHPTTPLFFLALIACCIQSPLSSINALIIYFIVVEIDPGQSCGFSSPWNRRRRA